jgi:hypothetical protein
MTDDAAFLPLAFTSFSYMGRGDLPTGLEAFHWPWNTSTHLFARQAQIDRFGARMVDVAMALAPAYE